MKYGKSTTFYHQSVPIGQALSWTLLDGSLFSLFPVGRSVGAWLQIVLYNHSARLDLFENLISLNYLLHGTLVFNMPPITESAIFVYLI